MQSAAAESHNQVAGHTDLVVGPVRDQRDGEDFLQVGLVRVAHGPEPTRYRSQRPTATMGFVSEAVHQVKGRGDVPEKIRRPVLVFLLFVPVFFFLYLFLHFCAYFVLISFYCKPNEFSKNN